MKVEIVNLSFVDKQSLNTRLSRSIACHPKRVLALCIVNSCGHAARGIRSK
jgi:hypothetical protein